MFPLPIEINLLIFKFVHQSLYKNVLHELSDDRCKKCKKYGFKCFNKKIVRTINMPCIYCKHLNYAVTLRFPLIATEYHAVTFTIKYDSFGNRIYIRNSTKSCI